MPSDFVRPAAKTDWIELGFEAVFRRRTYKVGISVRKPRDGPFPCLVGSGFASIAAGIPDRKGDALTDSHRLDLESRFLAIISIAAWYSL